MKKWFYSLDGAEEKTFECQNYLAVVAAGAALAHEEDLSLTAGHRLKLGWLDEMTGAVTHYLFEIKGTGFHMEFRLLSHSGSGT